MDDGGRELDSKALGQSKKPKCQDKGGTSFESQEPSKAWKRIPQKGDLKQQNEQQGKNQTPKPQEWGPSQLKTLEWAKRPQEEAVTEKTPADGGKVHKRPYCMLGDHDKNHQKEKCNNSYYSPFNVLILGPLMHPGLTQPLWIPRRSKVGWKGTVMDPE